MGITKTQLFSKSQNDLARVAKVLGHPARIAILEHLLSANQCINSQLVDELGLAQPTISQHLKELKEANLIQGTIEGNSVCYCINPEEWSRVQETLNQLFKRYTYSNSNCC